MQYHAIGIVLNMVIHRQLVHYELELGNCLIVWHHCFVLKGFSTGGGMEWEEAVSATSPPHPPMTPQIQNPQIRWKTNPTNSGDGQKMAMTQHRNQPETAKRPKDLHWLAKSWPTNTSVRRPFLNA